MADTSSGRLTVGDRSQGYEVTGAGGIAGLDAAYAGKDSQDGGAAVTLIHLDDAHASPQLFEEARSYERLDHPALIGPRTMVRFGAGAAVVVGKEASAPLSGETLAVWLKRRAPLSAAAAAALFKPILDGVQALHSQGAAHGMISAGHIVIDRDDTQRLFAPWVAADGEVEALAAASRAPEQVSGEPASPAADLYAIGSLLAWALSGEQAPPSEARLASRAQRDDDPYTPLAGRVDEIPHAIARLVDQTMRLHPATRPQSVAVIAQAFEDDAGEPAPSVAAPAPPPLPASAGPPTEPPRESRSSWPQTPPDGSAPPPLPERSRRGAGVPPVPRSRPPSGRSHTSTIGEAPPPLPSPGPGGVSGKTGTRARRKVGFGTILSFGIALAIAWFVASGGLGDDNDAGDPGVMAPESHERPVNRPENLDVDDAPRKGPRGDTLADERAEGPADGVLEQFCDSRFTFESARDSGTNALRRYLERCARFDTDYVEAARDALDLD